MLEAALVFPIVFFLLIGLVIGAMGIFSYQQVSNLACEGARYASVRGSAYAAATGNAAATQQDVVSNAITPMIVALIPSKLTTMVSWSPDNTPGSTVIVTVSYQWFPALYLTDPIVLQSTAEMTVTY
jgi:Flp pilus assembly protein TadG